MIGNLEFNLFKEKSKLTILSTYSYVFSKIKLNSVTLHIKIDEFIDSHPNLSFDNNFLKPYDFLEFCSLLEIDARDYYDEYYEFILNHNYSKIILSERLNLKLSQKSLAKKCNISPCSIGKFENNISYPTRNQYLLLKTHINV